MSKKQTMSEAQRLEAVIAFMLERLGECPRIDTLRAELAAAKAKESK